MRSVVFDGEQEEEGGEIGRDGPRASKVSEGWKTLEDSNLPRRLVSRKECAPLSFLWKPAVMDHEKAPVQALAN